MSLWSRAAEIAQKTPESRNRLVDFLRAASILAVISGHWLLAAPYVDASGFAIGNMLELTSYTQWLSWGFQVMPIFFLVGGYANAVSWRAAQRDGKSFSTWLDSRLRRLILPGLPLIGAWVVLAFIASTLGVGPEFVQQGSKIALIPMWFLAIYTLIVLFVPLTHAAWQRFGFGSFLLPAALAIADDVLFFAGYPSLGWFNYLFIWIAVHQLGFAWLDNRLASPLIRLGFGCFGLGLLYGLAVHGPYPIALISVPDDVISNTLPPKLPLLALAIAQAGFVLAAEAPFRRWLKRPVPWTAAVLLNGMIMTIYLWHSTAMVMTMGMSVALGNLGLSSAPGSGAWWLARPIWMAAYVVVLAALMPLVARFERTPSPELAAPAWRQVSGSLLVCVGLALLAYFGFGGTTAVSIQAIAALMPFAGALLAGLLPAGRRAPQPVT
jgi:surface polysaccharide O-acyltransferase-like enzyme